MYLFNCPSYRYKNDLSSAGQIVVSSTCKADEAISATTWSRAIPHDVVDTRDTIISTLEETQFPHCGCAPLNFTGIPDYEVGKVFHCDAPSIQEGNLFIDEDNSCQLFCDGILMWHLFCRNGYWSVELGGNSDIYCYGKSLE